MKDIRLEKDIEKAIKQALAMVGCWVEKKPTSLRDAPMARNMLLGTKGFSDTVVGIGDTPIIILAETKRANPRAYLNPAQAREHTIIMESGQIVVTWHSPEEAIQCIHEIREHYKAGHLASEQMGICIAYWGGKKDKNIF